MLRLMANRSLPLVQVVLASPNGADRVVGKFGRLHGGIPTDGDVIDFEVIQIEPLEPFPADHVPARGNRRLLVLRREGCRAHRCFVFEETGLRFPRRMQQIANLPGVILPRRDLDLLVGLGDGRQIEVLPTAAVEQLAGQIANVKALHHQDNGVIFLVVEPRGQRGPIPVEHPFPTCFRHGIRGLDRVVDDDQVAATSSQCAADRGRQTKALFGRLHLRLGILGRVDPGAGKDAPIPIGVHHAAAIIGVLYGKLLRIGDANDASGRIVAEDEGR